MQTYFPYKDHLWYSVWVPYDGAYQLVLMQGRAINEQNRRAVAEYYKIFNYSVSTLLK
jgi:hypothetical protein